MMTSDPSGLGDSPAPLSPESILSDRAGDVLGVGETSVPEPPPLSRAIMTLDAVTASGRATRVRSSSPDPAPADPDSPGHNRRLEILAVAMELFSERGYKATSLRDISSRVGISHPGMLHHFKSKETLLSAVIDRLEEQAQAVIDNLDAFVTTEEELSAIITREYAADSLRLRLLAVLTTEAINPELPERVRIIRLRRVWEHIAEHVARKYADKGELRDELDLPWAARTLISLMISVSTREATIGAIQPSAGGFAASDLIAFANSLRR